MDKLELDYLYAMSVLQPEKQLAKKTAYATKRRAFEKKPRVFKSKAQPIKRGI